jgi:uncharacterized membrane protein YqjE
MGRLSIVVSAISLVSAVVLMVWGGTEWPFLRWVLVPVIIALVAKIAVLWRADVAPVSAFESYLRRIFYVARRRS